jgi:ABC-type nitrate/sulfonate/bicarbonate transport system substrate-binding protein
MIRRLTITVFALTNCLIATSSDFVQLPNSDVRIAIHETTRAEFAAFVDATGYDATENVYSLRSNAFDWAPNGDTWRAPGYPQSDAHPIVGVSLVDARAYCQWLTEAKSATDPRFGTELEYRLPTDSEWSLAMGLTESPGTTPEARMASSETAYPWGASWPPPENFGNYAGTESAEGKPSWWGTIPGGYTDAYPRTSPVGTYAPNQLGLFDLSGNVWEWVDTKYTTSSLAYVIRGGCWGSDRPAYLLRSKRNPAFPNMRNDETGFRIVVAPILNQHTPVLLHLDWIRNVQFAGVLVAERDGLYAKAGLDVDIRGIDTDAMDPFAPVVDAPGIAIGVADGSALIKARQNGLPVKVFATMFQASPIGVITLKKSGLEDIKDLRGKRIGLHKYNVPQLEIMLRYNGLNLGDVEVIVIGDNVSDLADGKIDAQVCYIVDEAVALKTKGIDVNPLYGYENGYTAYSQVYFTTESMWKEHRELLKAFISASNQGWLAATDDIEASARFILERFQPELSLAYQTQSLELIAPLALGSVEHPISTMQLRNWLETPGATPEIVDALVDLNFARE